MKVSDYVTEDRISIEPDLETRDDVLRRLAEILCNTGLDKDVDSLLADLIEREDLGSTGIGGGIALPHIYLDVDDLHVAMIRTEKEIDFDAVDDEPCRIFFLIVGDKDAREPYLVLLSQISRFIRHQSAREEILKAATPAEILDALLRAESG